MNARVFGYVRVSTSERSRENQRMKMEAAGLTIRPDRWLVDMESGKVPALERPKFASLVHKLEAGDTLVVAELDRLGRNSVEVANTLRLLEGLKAGVVVQLDRTGTAGRVFRKTLAAIAEMVRDLLIERVQAGLARARAQGKAIGRPGRKTARQRQQIKKRVAGGASIRELSREFGISRSTAREILRPGAEGSP